ELAPAARMTRIAEDLAERRRRAGHRAMRAADVAFAVTPAALLRWGMARFDPTVRPPAVTGNTVVSSVNCGAADYTFGGAPVAMAAAFAGLSPMMGLTHVVVGVGDTVTIGVHAAESALGGPDGLARYLAALEAALA
nr:WS/DGAT domain-containing protein [Actinomycetota bacterium]